MHNELIGDVFFITVAQIRTCNKKQSLSVAELKCVNVSCMPA